MVRSLVVALLACAGVWLLASPGWALLAGAFLVFALWRREPDWRALGVRAAAAGRVLAGRLRAAPRHATSVTGMTAAVVLLPLGFGLAVGAGAALIAGAAGPRGGGGLGRGGGGGGGGGGGAAVGQARP